MLDTADSTPAAAARSGIWRVDAADLLLSSGRTPWVILDLAINFCGFIAFSWISPWHAAFTYPPELLVGAGTFSALFGAIALGLGLYERRARFRPGAVVSLVAGSLAIAMPL